MSPLSTALSIPLSIPLSTLDRRTKAGKKLVLLLVLAGLAAAQDKTAGGALVDRVGSTGFVQVRAESFRSLQPRQQILAYWVSQASIAIDPIIYDQNSRLGLRQKRILDAIAAHPDAVTPKAT